MNHWSVQYIGLPWAAYGQGPDEFDCWAFVRHVQRIHFGRDLPIIDVDANDRAAVCLAFATNQERQRWMRVDTPQEGDCVLVYKGAVADHVGMWLELDGGKVLHAVPRMGVVSTSVRALQRLGWNPIEFYRFAGV